MNYKSRNPENGQTLDVTLCCVETLWFSFLRGVGGEKKKKEKDKEGKYDPLYL